MDYRVNPESLKAGARSPVMSEYTSIGVTSPATNQTYGRPPLRPPMESPSSYRSVPRMVEIQYSAPVTVQRPADSPSRLITPDWTVSPQKGSVSPTDSTAGVEMAQAYRAEAARR
eukprot:RCo022128